MSYMSDNEDKRWRAKIRLLSTMQRFKLCYLNWSQEYRYKVYKYEGNKN